MPTYNGVEVWIEDLEHRKLNHQEMSINLIDGQTVAVKTEMMRDEFYTVHCMSSMSIFCDVFVVTAFQTRKRAARFHLDKTLAISEHASASSADHTEGQFRDYGLRTPKRLSRGTLGTLEVEIRRIGEIFKGEPSGECEVDRDEQVVTEFSMIDDFDQPPWLVFRFNINAKESSGVPGLAVRYTRKGLHSTLSKKSLGIDNQTSHQCFPSSRKRCLREPNDRDESANTDENPRGVGSDRLQQEYKEEEAEERRLLHKLQEQLQAKRARNIELRRLLGETL